MSTLHYRNYFENESVEVGDVVSLPADVERGAAYATCAVSAVTDIGNGVMYVQLSRTHLAFEAGAPQARVETFQTFLESFKTKYVLHVTGPSLRKDNRNYE